MLPSQQAFGATIKRICQKVINSEVMYERTFGKTVVRKRVKKYTLISSHTARRTGATNMYLAGIPTFRIMLLTGHTTEKSFFRYIRIQKEENARMLSEHPFFKGQ
jgi:integrase